MQVQRWPQAAPRLAQAGGAGAGAGAGAGKRMQNHAPYGCMAFFGKISGISGDFFACYRAASSARRRV